MSRRATPTTPAPAVSLLPQVHVIESTGVYCVDDAQRLLRLKASTIRREVRQGRLRISKRAGRYYLLGEWLLEWIKGGEIKPRRMPITSCNGNGGPGDE